MLVNRAAMASAMARPVNGGKPNRSCVISRNASRPCGPLPAGLTAGPSPSQRRSAGPIGRLVRRPTTVASAGQSDGENPWAAPGYKEAVVSQLPEPTQAAIVAAIFGAIGVATAFSCTYIGPFLEDTVPSGLFELSRSTWPLLGVTYLAAGVAHFGLEKGFLDMYPHRGAWGIYYLPGSAKFHVQWTGVAEALGGAGMLIGALPLDVVPSWIEPASALGMFALTWAVTPANIYMYTHNAPGPMPEGVDVPTLTWQGHLTRGVLQVFLLSLLWGIAHAPK